MRSICDRSFAIDDGTLNRFDPISLHHWSIMLCERFMMPHSGFVPRSQP